ncbi:TRAP transporter permease [Natronorubrum halophilum]|uniref:TRAP transporter permease n=1 Tax=Natronorubrum halophilum TaxID=1702106 RepID=UPI0010C22C48|nr:TRAP transporter fused permease subunit [Natronorubrum halophilum]
MSAISRRSDRGLPLRVLGWAVYWLGVSLTLYTVGYAALLLVGWPSALEWLHPTPTWLNRVEAYVIIFFGMGVALYYLEYAHERLSQRADERTTDAAGERPTDEVTRAPDAPRQASAEHDSSSDLEYVEDAYARIDPYVAVAFAAAALVATGYVYTNFGRLESDAFIVGYSSTDHLVGVVLIALAIDSTRRAFGAVIAAVAVGSIGYAHSAVGQQLFGVFRHSGMNWEQIAENGAVSISGVYDSTLMGIGSTWVAIFIMFAGIAKAYGLMDFVRTVGSELGSSLRTGVVQIAVISSMIMGSITGSAAANTATTGSFTIPMIKDQGVRDDVAASIEAVASAGGQMLPPVMGVAAFLMADIIGVPYLDIVRAGIIPAALFYFSVCVAVHFTILKFGWTSSELSPFDWRLLLRGTHFAIPMGVLLYTLVYLQYTPLTAGMYTIVAIIAVMYVRNVCVDVLHVGTGNDARDIDGESVSVGAIGRNVLATTRQTLDGFKQGGLEMAPLVGVLAAMGVIVELLEGTGLTGRVATTIIGVSDVTVLGFGGGLLLVLALAMIASVLFGLGMPTPAAYILVAILIARPVTEMGVPTITTHMFVFYFAMLSAITPPVAISVAIGSRIAGASFMRACVQALRLGAPGFVIPYAFVANNSLIYWSRETMIAFPVVLAGTIGLIVATIGFDGARRLSYPVRGLYVVAAFAAMFGAYVHVAVQIVAGAAILGVLGYARFVVGYQNVDSTTETDAAMVD